MKQKATKEKAKKETKAPLKKVKAIEAWVGMPEFSMKSVEPVKQLIVNFESMEDVHKFSKLVGQHITAKTRSIYYPEQLEEAALNKRWSKSKKK